MNCCHDNGNDFSQRSDAMKDAIRLGDSTTHGGKVLEAFSQTDLNGKPIAGVGHKVSCPLCKGIFPIAEGSGIYTVDGTPIALDGMKTACGAALIASGPKGAVVS
jgi:uncharacterized Zn-binding protein involved in type VI secretion